MTWEWPNDYSKRSRSCRLSCEITMDGLVYSIANLVRPPTPGWSSLYPRYRHQEARTQSGRLTRHDPSAFQEDGTLPKMIEFVILPVNQPCRPMAPHLSRRHDCTTFGECTVGNGGEQTEQLARSDQTPTVEAVGREQHPLVRCHNCKTPLICIYELKYVWCTACDHYDPLRYADYRAKDETINHVKLGPGSTLKRIQQALDPVASGPHRETSELPKAA